MKNKNNDNFNLFVNSYLANLGDCFTEEKIEQIFELAKSLKNAWKNGNRIFLCGNGGSAGNAIHIANDFIYGTGAWELAHSCQDYELLHYPLILQF